jgi:ketosteroid isomerase-like protein
MNDSAHDLQTLSALNARFIHNFITNDVASHDAILHPDFMYINSEGARGQRADYLRNWATGFDPNIIIYWDTRDECITVSGDMALVRATNKHIVRQDSQEITGMSAYTDTYVRQNGSWLCIQAQITRVSPAHYPPESSIVSIYKLGKRVA